MNSVPCRAPRKNTGYNKCGYHITLMLTSIGFLCKYTHSFVQRKNPSKHPALIYFTSEMISSILILEREFECMFYSHDNAAQNTYIQNPVYSLSICGNNPIIKYHIMSHHKACDLIVFSMYTFI